MADTCADRVAKHLQDLAAKMSGTLEVGFLEGATYPDGTPVAFWNEFGTTRAAAGPQTAEGENPRAESSPPRPAFRSMIAKESPEWGTKLKGALRATGNDGPKALALMGEDIQGALIQSINDFTSPALAASTIKRKGFDKPLIDKAIMVNSTGFRVVE
jgi:hypothetical protein